MFLMLTGIGACQKEIEELPDGNNIEVVKASSTTATLIKKISSKEGSYDNMVDGSSCFSINFPYVVKIGDIEIMVSARKDLEWVEALIAGIDDDDLDISFPVTITLSDYSEFLVKDGDQLKEWVETCLEEEGMDCANFVYPFKIYSFNPNEQQTGEVTVESDIQIRQYFKSLDDDDLVSFQFPIFLQLYDGTRMQVDSHSEMVDVIEEAKDKCEEDDDDHDYDFTLADLNRHLLDCSLSANDVVVDAGDSSGQNSTNLLDFEEDGNVRLVDLEGNTAIGNWVADRIDDQINLNLYFSDHVNIALEWRVIDIYDGQIKLIANGGKNRMLLQKSCNTANLTPELFRSALEECSWILDKVEVDDKDVERLLAYQFIFLPNGEVELGNGTKISKGTWEVSPNAQGLLVLSIKIEEEEYISLEWLLADFKEKHIKFSMADGDYGLVLEKLCDNGEADKDVVGIREIMGEGDWTVAKYLEDGDDEAKEYAGLYFAFSENEMVTVSDKGYTEHVGLWRVIRDSRDQLKCYLNFGDEESLEELSKSWKVVAIDPGRIELKDSGKDILVFERQ